MPNFKIIAMFLAMLILALILNALYIYIIVKIFLM